MTATDPDLPAALRLARHAAGLTFADLLPQVPEAAKIFLLDSLGVGIAGASAPGADRVRVAATRWGTGTEATLWGTNARLPAASAAFVNGFSSMGRNSTACMKRRCCTRWPPCSPPHWAGRSGRAA